MLTKVNQYLNVDCQNLTKTHKKSPSTSTDQSSEESVQIKTTKEKSQLCKKFMENGFCPYQKRCKFAHGSHELRKNDQVNSKYKTKECGSFKKNQYCMYGDRCNFIHYPQGLLQSKAEVPVIIIMPTEVDMQMQLIKRSGLGTSRLMKLLN